MSELLSPANPQSTNLFGSLDIRKESLAKKEEIIHHSVVCKRSAYKYEFFCQ